MCQEIHFWDGRVIEGYNINTRDAIFEGDDDKAEFHCLCDASCTKILNLVMENLGDVAFDDVDVILTPLHIEVRLKVERSNDA